MVSNLLRSEGVFRRWLRNISVQSATKKNLQHSSNFWKKLKLMNFLTLQPHPRAGFTIRNGSTLLSWKTLSSSWRRQREAPCFAQKAEGYISGRITHSQTMKTGLWRAERPPSKE